MRIGVAVLALAFAGTFLLPVTGAQAQTAPRVQTAQASQSAGTDFSAQSRRTRRPPTRIGSIRATTPTMSIRATFPAAMPCGTAPPHMWRNSAQRHGHHPAPELLLAAGLEQPRDTGEPDENLDWSDDTDGVAGDRRRRHDQYRLGGESDHRSAANPIGAATNPIGARSQIAYRQDRYGYGPYDYSRYDHSPYDYSPYDYSPYDRVPYGGWSYYGRPYLYAPAPFPLGFDFGLRLVEGAKNFVARMERSEIRDLDTAALIAGLRRAPSGLRDPSRSTWLRVFRPSQAIGQNGAPSRAFADFVESDFDLERGPSANIRSGGFNDPIELSAYHG